MPEASTSEILSHLTWISLAESFGAEVFGAGFCYSAEFRAENFRGVAEACGAEALVLTGLVMIIS